MRFKIEENLPADVGADLCAEGHEADTVAEEGLAGAADRTVLEGARVQGRVILKLDQGIADIRVYPAEMHGGVVCEFGDAALGEVCWAQTKSPRKRGLFRWGLREAWGLHIIRG